MSQALARSRARLRQRRVDRPPRPWGLGKLHLLVGAYLLAIIGVIVAYKVLFIPKISADLYFGIYGLVVTVYILSRFALSLAYRAPKERGLQPRVAIVMPGFNEEKAIATSLRSLLALDYPRRSSSSWRSTTARPTGRSRRCGRSPRRPATG